MTIYILVTLILCFLDAHLSILAGYSEVWNQAWSTFYNTPHGTLFAIRCNTINQKNWRKLYDTLSTNNMFHCGIFFLQGYGTLIVCTGVYDIMFMTVKKHLQAQFTLIKYLLKYFLPPRLSKGSVLLSSCACSDLFLLSCVNKKNGHPLQMCGLI